MQQEKGHFHKFSCLSLCLCLRFIIELCEPIQVKQLDIANFELFSSTPKDFLVSISDRSELQLLYLMQHRPIFVLLSAKQYWHVIMLFRYY